MPIKRFVALLALILMSFSAHSKVYQCTDANGAVVFQGTPCAQEAQETELYKAKQGKFGFHPSWFVSPRVGGAVARCTDTGCVCKDNTYAYQQNLNTRLLNAMSSLQGSWRYYQMMFDRYIKVQKNGKASGLKKSLDDAACRVAVNQKTIELYYQEVSDSIINEHEMASSAVNRINDQCRQPNETGWTNSDRAKAWVKCRDRNRKAHNQANRLKREYSGYYFSLMQERKKLFSPRSQAR
ncbi:DUF4124 domain-containing protein [Thalassotalea euphylliae]|uniref:DUF4124 domain-containing protein n=1 Tax=Thalassotalea euphylliae TaxID=1655234 RepID=A0A3E0TTC8_9GAMM|nr:DUF4124 domain-containing protein [Thalassotalea euphylliae]REL27723.1 DUF4124 domain-containing protein [Thalassotalea euphylliae]